MGWKFTISDRQFGNTTSMGILTPPHPPSNLEVTNIGDGQSADISWNKGGGSTSLVKVSINNGDFSDLKVDYASNTFTENSLSKNNTYKYRISSTGNAQFTIPCSISNPPIVISENITNNKLKFDSDWFKNRRNFKTLNFTDNITQPVAYSMDDYIYVNTNTYIYRNNI